SSLPLTACTFVSGRGLVFLDPLSLRFRRRLTTTQRSQTTGVNGYFPLASTCQLASLVAHYSGHTGERMKRIATFLIWTTLGGAPLYAMPSQITFQGTLKQQGA